jgi:hypothetical protein
MIILEGQERHIGECHFCGEWTLCYLAGWYLICDKCYIKEEKE